MTTEQQQDAPPMPDAPPPMPDAPPAVPPRAPGDRRVLRAALRWTAAVAAFAAVGTACAYGVVRLERTDLPGLETASDGRWTYPELSRAPLPSGSPGPLDPANKAGAHHADLRALLLPAPEGAKEDPALRGADGWLATGDFLAEYPRKEDREECGDLLTERGLRHVAARGWRMPDGTHTRIYLLQFDTAEVADRVKGNMFDYDSPNYAVRGAEDSELDAGFPAEAAVDGVERAAFVETEPRGAQEVRQAGLAAGDTVAVILQSRKGAAPAVPFQQTVVLQSQLLG